MMHVVYTHDKDGVSRIYYNEVAACGAPVYDERSDPGSGNLSTWMHNQRLVLADEWDGDRHWLGTYHQVAIYDRALSKDEVAAHCGAGPE